MKKRIVAVIVSVCVLLGAGYLPAIAASVQEGVGIAPFWTNTSAIVMGMSYSNGSVQWAGCVVGNTNAKNINVTYKLEKRGILGIYSTCNTWSFNSNSETLYSSGTYTGSSGTYRLTVSGTVTSNTGYAEPIADNLVNSLS